MFSDTCEVERAAATDFAQSVVRLWDTSFGTRLLGAYLIGSLAHGGFNARYSDIDVAVVMADALAPAELDTMREGAAHISERHAAKLSIFWADGAFEVGRFPPLDRLDFLDHAVRLVEREAVRPPRPSRADIRAYLGGTPFERWSARAHTFVRSEALDPVQRKAFLRAQLYPARFAYSWLTGAIASNDDAVAFLRADPSHGLDLDVIEGALRCRNEGRDPDDLFAVRGVLTSQIDICMRLMAAYP